MCREGGLTEFAEFGSPGSPKPEVSSKVGDPAEMTYNQSFSSSGSPRSPRSPSKGQPNKKVENNFFEQLHLENLNSNNIPTPPMPDPADLADPKAETIENALLKTDHPTDHPAEQLEVADPIKAADTVTTPGSLPSGKALAVRILQCQTWGAMAEAIDAVATATNKDRKRIFDIVLTKYLPKDDRHHLVSLLTNHLRQFPQDESAYNWLPNGYWC